MTLCKKSDWVFAACAMILVLAMGRTVCGQRTTPVIDMHFHSQNANSEGPPPAVICAPFEQWPAWDPKDGMKGYFPAWQKNPPCAKPLLSPKTDDEVMQRSIAALRSRNVYAVTSGPRELVSRWKAVEGERVMVALNFNPATGKPSVEELRKLASENNPVAFSEILGQYLGVAANDPRMEPYYSLAEELDIPVGIHMGPGPPGTPYQLSGYRMRNSSLLLLEDVLVRHPRLRVWAMHAGWPLGDDAIAALYTYPQLYVDIGVIDYLLPRAEFYSYLKRVIDAGFENRVMFGSDEMVWPEALGIAIDTIESAPMLTEQQKRDILYNNAARFLRLPAK